MYVFVLCDYHNLLFELSLSKRLKKSENERTNNDFLLAQLFRKIFRKFVHELFCRLIV